MGEFLQSGRQHAGQFAAGYALRLDGERLRSLWVLPLQQVVYRQLMYLVTIQSVITALIGTRQRWLVIRRAGSSPTTLRPAPCVPSACAADAVYATSRKQLTIPRPPGPAAA